MNINLLAVLAATVVMFAVGAVWYMVTFAKAWGKIHGFDKLSEKEQKKKQAIMGPWYVLQLLVTIISAWILTALIGLLPEQSPYFIVALVWIGFVLPTTAGNMIFGGSPEGYVWHKIAISGGESLVRLLAAAWVISLF